MRRHQPAKRQTVCVSRIAAEAEPIENQARLSGQACHLRGNRLVARHNETNRHPAKATHSLRAISAANPASVLIPGRYVTKNPMGQFTRLVGPVEARKRLGIGGLRRMAGDATDDFDPWLTPLCWLSVAGSVSGDLKARFVLCRHRPYGQFFQIHCGRRFSSAWLPISRIQEAFFTFNKTRIQKRKKLTEKIRLGELYTELDAPQQVV